MIRSKELVDKLIADLHFHGYLYVNESSNIFCYDNEEIEGYSHLLETLNLGDFLNPHTDFYHGGTVSTADNIQQINRYIDDVLIDYFFRTHEFEDITFPKGICYEQITPKGIIHSQTEVSLNLNNIYNRCTFAQNIWRLFGVDKSLYSFFPNNSFIQGFYANNKIYGLHSSCGILINDKPFYKELDEYIIKKWHGNCNIDPVCRGKEIYRYIDFLHNEYDGDIYGCSPSYQIVLSNFFRDFQKIRDNHLFGKYTIEDILFIYSLLTDKFVLSEDAFLLSLCFCFNCQHKNRILEEFIDFEAKMSDYHDIEHYIYSNDLCLRFASHTKSKAFKFTYYNDAVDEIRLFNKHPIMMVKRGNTMPLPYLYSNLQTI